MIYCHAMQKVDCLSHQIWPAVEKGFPKDGKDAHFFWGLAEHNINKITQLEKDGSDWYFIDTGYLTEQITRYPEPKINDYDKTYFRIVKGGVHTLRGSTKGGKERLKQLDKKGIRCTFEGWNQGEGDHILICPSSETMTHRHNGMSQGRWVASLMNKLTKLTNRDVRVRNKPRPNNEWWGKDIKEDLDGAHCLITNMSLTAIDAVLEGIPIITDTRNVAWPVSSRYIEFINDPLKPTHDKVNNWLKLLANNQFNLKEIEDGTAFNIISNQGDKLFTV
tara:strand:+ start:744 stop:1574 length:831 start_codon:yes stop_codon:yes gene_type:complete